VKPERIPRGQHVRTHQLVHRHTRRHLIDPRQRRRQVHRNLVLEHRNRLGHRLRRCRQGGQAVPHEPLQPPCRHRSRVADVVNLDGLAQPVRRTQKLAQLQRVASRLLPAAPTDLRRRGRPPIAHQSLDRDTAQRLQAQHPGHGMAGHDAQQPVGVPVRPGSDHEADRQVGDPRL
jgi:hypothetical protein